MYSTQIFTGLTPEQLSELLRRALREELTQHTLKIDASATLPEYLTRKETANLLRISLVSLNSWGKDTDDRKAILCPIKINSKVRYRRDEVMALLSTSPKYRRNAK